MFSDIVGYTAIMGRDGQKGIRASAARPIRVYALAASTLPRAAAYRTDHPTDGSRARGGVGVLLKPASRRGNSGLPLMEQLIEQLPGLLLECAMCRGLDYRLDIGKHIRLR